MLLLLLEEALRNEDRKVSITMPRFLKSAIQIALNILPQLIALRPKYDTAANRRIIHKLCFFNNIYIPSREILALRRNFCYKLFVL
ncbi:hypothetical protein D3C79_1001590 [compost metagenome]